MSYRILATISYGRHVPETPPSPALESADSPASLFDGQVIGAPADLRAALGWSDADTRALDVDWDRSRVLVFDAFASYRLGELYGKTVLSGIYERGGSIVVHSTHTNYGPCQGIRQDPSWFSFGGDYLLLVIPREPEPITRWDCSIGGCPPDIP